MTSGALPALYVGRRRRLLTTLAALGLAQAALSILTAFLTPMLLTGTGNPATLSLVLVGAAALVGAARIGERVVSEDLGQDYVREVRRLLVASALVPDRTTNLGTTIARATNDLTAVKNWVALGISPIVVGVPLISGVVIAMLILTPALAFVVTLTLSGFGALMLALSGPLLRRARGLRQARGQMAGHIADTVTAGEAIRVSGGVTREVGRIDKLSAKVMEAARARAVVSGAMRGSAASATAVLAVLVAVVGTRVGSSGADITTAVFISGMLAAPITDLGRVAEYRQNLNAAHRVLAPVLANARAHHLLERRLRQRRDRFRRQHDSPGLARGAVHVADLTDRDGPIPELVAAPGSRVLLVGQSTARIELVLRELTAHRSDPDGWVMVAGRPLNALPARERRPLVGFASRSVPLERGTIARVARYRVPDDEHAAAGLLDRVGLRARLEELPEGERTQLRRGGEPLTVAERARLKLARALAGDPPLVILDHLDDELDAAGRAMLAEVLDGYPGCVIVRSSMPEAILACYDVWNVDELTPSLVIALPAAAIPVRGPRRTTHFSGSGGPVFGAAPRRSAAARAALRARSPSSEASHRRREEDGDEDE